MDDRRSLRVARDGSGDFSSVQAGVDASSDGGCLLIGPGEYPEPVRIDKLLEVVGAGRGRTVLGAAASTEPALRIAASATLRRLTIVGSEQFYRDPQSEDLPHEEGDSDPLELAVYGGRPHQAALLIARGRTTLEDIEVVTASGPGIRVSASCDVLADDCAVLPAADWAGTDGATGETAVIIDDGAATLTGCTIRGELVVFGQSSVVIVSRSRLMEVRASGSLTVHDSDACCVDLGFCRATLIGNRIAGADRSRLQTVMVASGSTVLLAGNSITGPGGIVVHGAGTVAVIEGNSIGADRICIRLQDGASALIEDNRLHEAEVGVRVAGESTRARMRRNDVAVRRARVECAAGGRVDDDGD